MNHPIEAEEGILACCLLDENNIDVVAKSIERDAFWDVRTQNIWGHMLKMRNEGTPVDSITLTSRIRAMQDIDMCGGAVYLGELPDKAHSAVNLPVYIEDVKEAYACRKGQEMLSEASLAIDGDSSADQVFSLLESTTIELKEKHGKGSGKRTVKDVIHVLIEQMEAAANGENLAIATGFDKLDDKLGGGLHNKELSVIASRPSMGKSTLAKDIALNIAGRGTPVGVFSLEDPAEGFMLRAIASKAKVPASYLRTGAAPEAYYKRIVDWTRWLSEYPLHLEDDSPLSCSELVSRMGELKRKENCRAFIIDYLQYVKPDGQIEKRDQQVAEISRGLKSAAKRLDVPILTLAQLNREADQLKPGVHPIERHLGESSSIEKDADVIMMLHKDEHFDEDGDFGMINLHILKQRNGPRYVNIPLSLNRPQVRFEER